MYYFDINFTERGCPHVASTLVFLAVYICNFCSIHKNSTNEKSDEIETRELSLMINAVGVCERARARQIFIHQRRHAQFGRLQTIYKETRFQSQTVYAIFKCQNSHLSGYLLQHRSRLFFFIVFHSTLHNDGHDTANWCVIYSEIM